MKKLNNNKYAKDKIPISSEKTEIQKIQKKKHEIPILELLKCPICKKICLMNINKDKLLFSFECTNNHKNKNKDNKFKKCRTNINDSYYSFPSDFSELNLSKEYNINFNKINNKDNNTSKISNNTIQKLYISEKDFTCQTHPNLIFDSYCFECKKNLCEECKKDHLNHNQINLNSIKPNDKEVFLCKKNIKKNEVILWNLIEYIQTWKNEFDKGLNTLIKIMENIFNLKEYIINNYDQKQKNNNYNYLQNFNNIKTLDFIFPELLNFSDNNKSFKQTGFDIIETIYNIQTKIAENKKKIKSMTESQINKVNNINNNIPKNNIINIESTETSPSSKKNDFNTAYSSDCINNNFYERKVTKSVGFTKAKKKILQRNKIDEISENPNMTRTIEQNNNLEKSFKIEDNNIIKDKNNISESEIIIKNIELNNNNKEEEKEEVIKENQEQFIIEQNEEYDINNNKNSVQNINVNIIDTLNTFKENSEQNILNQYNINLEDNNNIYKKARDKYIFKGIDLRYEITNTDIIRSIEFLNPNRLLISTLENISIYKITSKDELIKEFDIKEFNYRINYATKLSDDNIIICSLNNINIIKLSEEDLGTYDIIQTLEGKNNSENINKIKEIVEKNYLISCDKNNIILFEKNPDTNLFSEKNYIKTNSEVKCFEIINNNLLITVEPETQKLIFYTIDSLQKKYEIKDIQSSFGRYIICYLEQYESIFITGRFGIYLISSKNFDKKIFFKVGEWISSINYDIKSNCLFCGTWIKDSFYNEKNYNLIIYEILNKNNENIIDNIKLREISRKNNAHNHDIVVVQPSYDNGIITGSNDNTVKLWK